MRILVAVAVLITAMTSCSRGKQDNVSRIVLPNPGLLRTCPTNRPQLWRDPRTSGNAIYPAKFHIDLGEGGCSYGFTRWYDKSVSLEEVRTAINQRYGKWELADFARPGSKMRLWRIESERFVIQLTEVAAEDKDENPGESGMTQLIYLPISDRPFKSLCDCP